MKTIVNTWAIEGSPRVTVDQVRGQVDVAWGHHMPKPNRLLAWLHPDALLARLIAQAKQQAEKRGEAMSSEQKAETIKALTETLAALEAEEVGLIDAMQEQGVAEAQHRLDISPWALLGVREPRGLVKTALVA